MMSFKKLTVAALFVAGILLGNVFAQTATVAGTVYKLGEGEEKVPVEGVKIVCYRTDIKQGCRETTTDKRGEFIIAGVPLVAKIILGVSGPDLSPTVFPEVKASQAGAIAIQVEPGDGSEATEDEIRDIAARQFTGELTADQKAEMERIEKERLAIIEKNKKVEERNALRLRLLQEGEAAFNNKEYQLAADKFNEGYEADPDFLGSAPVFLNNAASSQKKLAVDIYNEAAKTKDQDKITAAKVTVAKYFTDCLTATLKAHKMASDAAPSEIINPEVNKKNIKLSEDIVKDTFRILGLINMNLAGFVGTAEEASDSVVLYKSSLAILPDNPDVLSGLMFALYMSSSLSGDQALMQESLNYGAYYLTKADPKHAQREAVTELVDQIKSEGLKPGSIN